MKVKDYFIPVNHTFEFIDTDKEAKKAVKSVL